MLLHLIISSTLSHVIILYCRDPTYLCNNQSQLIPITALYRTTEQYREDLNIYDVEGIYSKVHGEELCL